MNMPPIFIHSLFRAGSTYLFKAFRRSDVEYWCYQESLHEAVIDANDKPENLIQGRGEDLVKKLRHPRIDVPYFQELYDTWPAWKGTLSASAIYNGYFAPSNADIGISYWRALAKVAKGRPVFQECRTAARIGAIKEQLGGYHISLWRNPWDQWWSYKVAQYFDVANQLIINAPNSPAPVRVLRSALGFETYSHVDIAETFAHFWVKPLSAEESYLVFYLLWCLGLQEGAKHAHLMLNIDRLSDSPAYRDEVQKQLEAAGIIGIDFSDCHIPQGVYSEQDNVFFVALEDKVYGWLKAGGWSQHDLNQVQALRQQFSPASWREPIGALTTLDLAEQATRARALVRRFETKVAEIAREGAAKVAGAEAGAQQSEIRAQQAEARAHQEAVRAEQAESHAQQAEARAHQEAVRAEQAESHAQQAEARAYQEAVRAEQAESRAQQAEARAYQEAVRAEQAESRAQQSETCAQQAEIRSSEQEQRAVAAESLARHYQQQANEWHERVISLYDSTSWKITKPVRALSRIGRRLSIVGEVPSATAKLRQFVRARIISTINWAVDCARSSPGFKHFALRLLRGQPSLQQKLRRVYLENQRNDQPQPINWSVTTTDIIMSPDINACGEKRYVLLQLAPDGINANQRTPLESNFHTYRDQP